MSAIVTERLTKKYGGVAAVDNLNLTVEQGELFGDTLIGRDAAAPFYCNGADFRSADFISR